MVDSLVGSVSKEGSKYEFVVGPSSALSVGFVLGMQADSNSARSVTEEYFIPAILQSIEGIFQCYAHWMHSMYSMHEGTPFDNAQIPHRCSTRLIRDLVLLLDH